METLLKIIRLGTILLIGVSQCLYADDGDLTIRGLLIDNETGKPIKGGNIYIIDYPSLNTSSNTDGRFEIIIPEQGKYELGAFAFGYERTSPRAFTIDAQQAPPAITLRLLPTISKMPPVVVTATREQRRAESIKLTGKDMASIAGTGGDPVRGLQYLPGIAVQYDYSAQPAVRGSTPDENAYYVDFLPVRRLFHADGAVSVLPDEFVSQFDLQASAFDSAYDDVTGAVIDIELRDPEREKFTRQIDLKSTQVGLLLEGPTAGNQSLLFSVRQSYLDLVVDEVSLDPNNIKTATPEFSDYLGKYVWNLSADSKVSLNILGTFDKIGFEVMPGSDFARQQPTLVGKSSIDTATNAQAVVWQFTPNKTLENKLAVGRDHTANYSMYGSAIDEDEFTQTEFVRNLLRINYAYTHQTTLSLETRRKRVTIHADALNANCTAFDAECNLSAANRLTLDETLQLDSSAYALSHQWQMNEDTDIIFGVRASTDDYLNASFTEPRVKFKYRATRRTEWSFGLGKHHQRPETQYIVPNFGNPQLKPIESTHAVAGYRNYISEQWMFQSELYAKSFDKLIMSDLAYNYINGGEGQSTGIEILVKKKSSMLSGWFALTASKSELTDTRNDRTFPFAYDQPLNASLVVNYHFRRLWKLGMQWQFHTGLPFTPVTNGVDANGIPNSVYGDINSERLPDYHRLDLRIEYRQSGKKMQTDTFFEIINVYNRENVAGYTYGEYFRKQSPLKQLPVFFSFGIKTKF